MADRRSWKANMQPKQNIWNVVLFTLLAFLVLIGWTRLQNWISPPPPPPAKLVVKKLPDPRLWADLPALASGSTASSAVGGVGNLSQLVTDMAVAQWAAQERP